MINEFNEIIHTGNILTRNNFTIGMKLY